VARIWFVQQKPLHYVPLRWGLGYLSEEEARKESKKLSVEICPKIFTTRTHRLMGDYVAIEGSRYKAKPVEPRIEFEVKESWEFDIKTGKVTQIINGETFQIDASRFKPFPDEFSRYTFPELDLGIRGTTFDELKHVLIRLNTKVKLGMNFYINRLEPKGSKKNV